MNNTTGFRRDGLRPAGGLLAGGRQCSHQDCYPSEIKKKPEGDWHAPQRQGSSAAVPKLETVPWAAALEFATRQARRLTAWGAADCEDMAQEAAVAYFIAWKRGDRVASMEAFITVVLRRQLGKLARYRRLWHWHEPALPAALEHQIVPASTFESSLHSLLGSMPDPLAAWCADLLERLTDDDLARRHGVSTSAIRKRRERVEDWIRSFLQVPRHNRRVRGTKDSIMRDGQWQQ